MQPALGMQMKCQPQQLVSTHQWNILQEKDWQQHQGQEEVKEG